MKIYTKTGDAGETGLFGGPRVQKSDPILCAYGTVDELNAVLGFLQTYDVPDLLRQKLERIQNELFDLGADLATPWPEAKDKVARANSKWITPLETEMDAFEEELQQLKTFILPGGSRVSAILHMARTVCRRAEREMVACLADERINPEAIMYTNRLSDWFFVAARWANKNLGHSDVAWQKRNG